MGNYYGSFATLMFLVSTPQYPTRKFKDITATLFMKGINNIAFATNKAFQ